MKLKVVNDQILLLLANSKEDILEDTELRESLADAKSTQQDIDLSNEKNEKIMKSVDQMRAEN